MSNPQDDLVKRFQAMIATLPQAKRDQIYNALKAMKPEQVQPAMRQILAKYDEAKAMQAGAQAPVQQAPAQRVAPQQPAAQRPQVQQVRPQAPAGQPAQRPQQAPTQQPVRQMTNPNAQPQQAPLTRNKAAEPVVEELEPAEETPKKKVKASPFAIILLIVVILLAIVAAVLTFVLKDDGVLKKLFGGDETTTTAVETVIDTEASTEATTEVTESTEPSPTPTPAPTMIPLREGAPDLSGLTIVIDPGHQAVADMSEEMVSPNGGDTKPRCTTGAVGVSTGVTEYELTLQYALIIRDYLTQCGANVILTRETNDVNISNQERALVAVNNNADLYIRLHADRANTSYDSGVYIFVPNSGDYSDSVVGWGDRLGHLIADAEGLTYINTIATDGYTGLNFAGSVRSFQICLGLLSNSDDEAVLTNEENIGNVAEAISNFCADFTL